MIGVPKPTPKGRKQKSDRQKIIKRMDDKFSQLVRSRGRCERCGKTTDLQCAHLISRRNLGLRWDTKNALCLCYSCHLFFAHKEVLLFAEWVRGKRGQREYDLLIYRGNQVTKYTTGELSIIERELNGMIKEIGSAL